MIPRCNVGRRLLRPVRTGWEGADYVASLEARVGCLCVVLFSFALTFAFLPRLLIFVYVVSTMSVLTVISTDATSEQYKTLSISIVMSG
jgi:hypothetical protein